MKRRSATGIEKVAVFAVHGNPDRQGVTEVAGLALGDPSYVGVQGTTPISFARGHKTICTFYNRSAANYALVGYALAQTLNKQGSDE